MSRTKASLLEQVTDQNRINKTKKVIENYVELIDKVDKLPFPGSTDCWDCSLLSESGEVRGDVTKSFHLQFHLAEGRLQGSLIVNAMRESGHNDYQISLHYQMEEAGMRETLKRALRQYFYKRLLPGTPSV